MFEIRLFVFLLALFPSLAPVQPPPGVPAQRLTLLDKGVNLSHWLWLPAPRSGHARLEFITHDDLAFLRSLGTTHVRLPFEPSDIWDPAKHELKDSGLLDLRLAIERCLAADLAVIVDAHPTQAPWSTPDDPAGFAEFEHFWSALAKDLASTSPDRVFLEILNEPHDLKDPALWPAAQSRLAAAIRAAAPQHTIIATGDDWGNISGLLRLKPLPDPNIIYTFHFYDPHNFTHQGATWGWAPWKHMKGLPYPSSPETLAPIAAKIEDKQARDATLSYGKDRWDAAKLRTEIAKAADWSRANHVPV
jgi:endoglucanase